MAIVTSAEIKTWLGLTASADARTLLIASAIEQFLKEDLGRAFEEATYTTLFDVEGGQKVLFCADRPITVFTSLHYVSSRASDGTPTYTAIDADEYVVDLTQGAIKSLGGLFPAGRQRIKAVYTAGYTAAQVTASSGEIATVKHLIFSILQREYHLAKDKRHMRSTRFEAGSAVYQFDLDAFQLRLRAQLDRGWRR